MDKLTFCFNPSDFVFVLSHLFLPVGKNCIAFEVGGAKIGPVNEAPKFSENIEQKKSHGPAENIFRKLIDPKHKIA